MKRCTVPEIYSMTDWSHFVPFYPTLKPQKLKFWKYEKTFAGDTILQMCTQNQNHNVRILRYGVRQNFDILGQKSKLKKKKKRKKACIYYPLHMNTIDEDHIWFLKKVPLDFLSFWIIFHAINPLTIQKIKILKNWK